MAAAHGEGDRELGTGWCVQEGQVHKKEEEEKRGMLGVGGGWGGGIKENKVHVQRRRRPDAEVIKTFTTCEVAGIKDGKGPRIDLQVGRKELKKEGRKEDSLRGV